ncbi:MAG: ATP synthase F0 subunit B [Deltaproteobacteria bacterium]|nr:ATP synthase F0 subunit B [Deltaproteobacteria bacterium]
MDAFAGIAAQLGIDQSFYYLFAMVFVLYGLLSLVYLKPFQHLLHDRKLKTEGARKEAEELTKQAEEAFSQYKKRLKEVTDKSREAMHEAEESAKKEEAKIVGDASQKAKAALQNTQKELEAQRKAVLDALGNEISGIANDIAAKAMGR